MSSARLSLCSGIILAALLAGCTGKMTPAESRDAALEELRAEVRATIDDPERRALALEGVDELGRLFTDAELTLNRQRDELRALNRDYDATYEQYEALIQEAADYMADYRLQVLETRATLLSVTTEEEWAALRKHRSRAVEKSLRALNP